MGVPLGAVAIGVGLGLLVYFVIRSLTNRPRAAVPEVPPVRVVGEEEPGTPAPWVRVYTKDGESDVRMVGAGAHPSVPGRRALRFVVVLVVSFAAIVFLLLHFYGALFGQYDHLVALTGSVLYWPLAWPGVYAIGVQKVVVPDYIFPMYLAAMGAFVIASGLAVNHPEYTARRRLLALAVVLTYFGCELVVDSLFFTIPGIDLRGFALLVRGMTGGLFLALLTFCAFYLPPPQRVVPELPRRRSEMAPFFLVALLAVAISAAGLVGAGIWLHAASITIGLTLLLLVPILALTLFGVLGRPLYFRQLRLHPLPSATDYHPSVSIVMPAYNEEANIEEAIRGADRAAARYPGRVEIIVGNDGSTDHTLELARRAIAQLEHTSGTVVDLPHGGKSNALNGAVAVATGEIVLRCDGDTVISEDPGFARMIAHFADPEVGIVQGAIHPRQRVGWTRKLRALEIAWNHYLLRPANMGTHSSEVVDGLFSAVRREKLLQLGGYVPWNGEDSELSMRVQRAGYRARIEFGALAYEDVPANYDELRRQRVRWSRGIMMANGQHYPALLGPTPEFAGLGVLFWFLLVIRSGVRSLVYLYLGLLILILGIPALIFTLEILLLALAIRAIPLAYFLVKMKRRDVLVWVPFFPIGNIIKQTFRFESFGTLGPQATREYF